MEAVAFLGWKRAEAFIDSDRKRLKRILGSIERTPLPTECNDTFDVMRGFLVALDISVSSSYKTMPKRPPQPIDGYGDPSIFPDATGI